MARHFGIADASNGYRIAKEAAFNKRRPNAAYAMLYHRIKHMAIKDGHEFLLSKDEVLGLVQGICSYCGIEPCRPCYPKVIKGGRKGKCVLNYDRPSFYNGIDRKDSDLGYTLENCVTCCKWCNYAKRDRTTEEFMTWIKLVYDWNFNRPIKEIGVTK